MLLILQEPVLKVFNEMTLVLRQQQQKEQIDECGFIFISEKKRQERHKYLAKLRYLKGGSTIGRQNHCRLLCKYLPKKVKMPNSLQMIPGTYWCKECECIMKCTRCRCCGNLGRSKARNRKRTNEKRID